MIIKSGGQKMKPIAFNDINIKGELAVRSGLNFARLEGDWYRPQEVFKADSHGWPADWEGRIILGLTLASQATHRTAAYLDEIVSMIPSHLNKKGYFGPILEDGRFDEQHFGGHSWILRALVEYYYMTGKEEVKTILEGIVKGFLLPVKGKYCKYPIEPVKRFEDQGTWILSKLQTKTKHHAETSDAGCAFIMMDGATAAYELLKWDDLKIICREIIERYLEMDFEALHIQTHATLSGIRGILRFYEITGEQKYLDSAVKMFDLYKRTAWTEAYGNYNWFGAPRWTEPCAIIDSLMVSTNLWKHTRNPVYLNDAHLIYFNAICHGNRINGSFGTDRCLGAAETEDNLFLTPINYETYWCCTMRGGEGFSRAIEYNFFLDGDNVFVPFFNSCTATLRFDDGLIKLEEIAHYPYDGKVSFTVLESTVKSPKTFNFFIPDCACDKIRAKAQNGFMTCGCLQKAGDVCEFDLGPSLHVEDAVFENSIKGYHKFMYGPVLMGIQSNVEINSLDGNRFENYAEAKYKSASEIKLGKDTQFERVNDHEFKVVGTDYVMSLVCSVKDMAKEDTMRQVLFTN